ncbi:hypothetical protein [Weissella hellenica]
MKKLTDTAAQQISAGKKWHWPHFVNVCSKSPFVHRCTWTLQ